MKKIYTIYDAGFLLVEMLEGLQVPFTGGNTKLGHIIQWGPLTQQTKFSHTIDLYTKDKLHVCFSNQRLTFL